MTNKLWRASFVSVERGLRIGLRIGLGEKGGMGGYTQAAYLRCTSGRSSRFANRSGDVREFETRDIEIYFSAARWEGPGISSWCSSSSTWYNTTYTSEPCSWVQSTAIPSPSAVESRCNGRKTQWPKVICL